MRIAHLTAGTGSYYCGTCLRDHALAEALTRLGHPTTLVPLYLPLVVETGPAARAAAPVFLGAAGAYLRHRFPLLARRAPRWLERMLDARRVLALASRFAGTTSGADLGGLALDVLAGDSGGQAGEIERIAAWLAEADRPDIVCLSNALLSGLAPVLRRVVGVPVVCSLQGEDAFLDSLPSPARERAWDLVRERADAVDAYIAVSEWYARTMRERLALPPERVHVVQNGIPLSGYPAPDAARLPPDPPAIGYVAQLAPGKGVDALVAAWLRIRQRGRVGRVRLELAGSLPPAGRPAIERVRERAAQAGLEADLGVHPNLDREAKIALLARLTVLSVPATHGEAFGLYVLEALAAGVPVVLPRHGALTELVETTGGGLLCAPQDPEALAAGLEALLSDPAEAARLGHRGCAAVHARFGAAHMAGRFLDVLEQVRARASARGHARPRTANGG
jgi:glycosyltransferase involved in cell wall biosynthesis